MVDYTGLENRRAERHRGFESLSLRSQRKYKSSVKRDLYFFFFLLKLMIRKATIEDLETILLLIDEGRRKMIAEGNVNQWSGGRPSREMFIKDITEGVCHLVVIDGRPVATFALIEGPDPTYARIYDGEWQNDNPYYVIHRVASLAGVHGIMRTVLNHAFSLTDTIRIDTHNDNVTMRTLLAKYGFSYCGIILLENGDPRLAFQKTL